MADTDTPTTEAGRRLTPEEAVDKALLYVFQLSGKDYAKMQTAFSATAFIRALAQDGYAIEAEARAGLDVADVLTLVRKYRHERNPGRVMALYAAIHAALARQEAER